MASGLRWTEEQWRERQKNVRARMLLEAIAPSIPVPPVKVRPKYGNVKTERDGVTYDSAKESRVLKELETLERAGQIRDLRRQVKFAIVVNGHLICAYIADATFIENEQLVVVDVKSPGTRKLPVYRLKAKLMRAVHGIEISER